MQAFFSDGASGVVQSLRCGNRFGELNHIFFCQLHYFWGFRGTHSLTSLLRMKKWVYSDFKSWNRRKNFFLLQVRQFEAHSQHEEICLCMFAWSCAYRYMCAKKYFYLLIMCIHRISIHTVSPLSGHSISWFKIYHHFKL